MLDERFNRDNKNFHPERPVDKIKTGVYDLYIESMVF
jgi:hypothetical protein